MSRKRTKRIKRRYIVIVLVVILIIFGYIGIKKSSAFYYICKEENPCKECKVVVSCLNIQEKNEKAFVYFKTKNQNNIAGNCSAQIYLTKDNLTLINATYEIGIIGVGESAKDKVLIDLPGGKTRINVIPSCNWLG